MLRLRPVPALFTVLTLLGAPLLAGAQQQTPLRVIRVTPSGGASPMAEISVTFDRPVAGSLDRTVSAAGILSVEPAVPGTVEWRDPVTIRLRPTTTLTPGSTYAVTVANTFAAMDGSALSEPYRFSFRVRGATLLTGLPVDSNPQRTITPDTKFTVVYSAAVDLARLSTTAYLEFNAVCAPTRIIHLRATTQAPIAKDDSWPLRDAGGWRRDRAADSLRRIVTLTPEQSLPHGCDGLLVLPREADEQLSQGYARWPFITYGDFNVVKLTCEDERAKFCPSGPLAVHFSTPVRGAEVQRYVKTLPETKFTIGDTTLEATTWVLDGKFKPRMTHAVVVDTAIRDVMGQSLRGNPAVAFRTTGYEPSIVHPYGTIVVERAGNHALSVQHMNVDTLIVEVAPVPDSVLPKALARFGWSHDSLWMLIAPRATERRIAVRSAQDRAAITSVSLPLPDARQPNAAAIYALRIRGRANGTPKLIEAPATLIQVTDLGLTARVGLSGGGVWVTGVEDGKPRPGATVSMYDATGKLVATTSTDARGLARLGALSPPNGETNAGGEEGEGGGAGLEGYVVATLGADRAVTPIDTYDPDLSPWRFGVSDAWGDTRLPLAGAVFTERGIYRPGERVYAKAIVRDGTLGALRAAAGDSIRWQFHDRDEGMLREVTTRLSAFGTDDQSVQLPATAAVGYFTVDAQVKRLGSWRTIGTANYRVAEYRPPEFLVDLNTPAATPKFPGDTVTASIQARYLFGAPMGRAEFTWIARQTPMSAWELSIPGYDDWTIGGSDNWDDSRGGVRVIADGTDTLDARGERSLRVAVPATEVGGPSRITIETSVSDINRQVVGSSTTAIVHPADFYIAVKPVGTGYFWTAGTLQQVNVAVVRPDGTVASGVDVKGTLIRREWHRVRRERHGLSELVGEWVTDTVRTCNLTSAATPGACSVTPTGGGIYMTVFRATDARGRPAMTTFTRWVVGTDFVPWNDESQFKMDVIPDKQRYSVGDTATVLFAAPFIDAEAWVTVEREGIISQQRLRITSGSTTIKLPITEAYSPNAYVSIVVVRGRSAPPTAMDDPGRPTMRIGYASLRVTPETKRLTVTLTPAKTEFRPGDSARVRIAVRDAKSRGQRSEVTLWAVDEGVLALTGYKTPDPIDLIYRERGLGMRLRSNLTTVAPEIPEGEKGSRDPGGGGGAAGADILRSRFQTTAFFIGSVVTDEAGNATAVAKLPDNLTTFRVMAVAVTAGDRYGNGQSSVLVTRPLLARQALPRFVRPGDTFEAGAVINRRDGAAVSVDVSATATGITLSGAKRQTTTLAASRGAEVRFPFTGLRGDSASFRFDVTTSVPGPDSDAVRVAIPVKPDFHPRAQIAAGVLRDTSTVEMTLPADIDPARSTLSFNLGTSPLAMIRGMSESMHVYPYYCSEQVVSTAIPILALYRAGQQTGAKPLTGNPRLEIIRAVELLTRRQRLDGAIGYWSAEDWSTSWLSAYAGLVMLDARDVGVPVDSAVLRKLADFVAADLHGTSSALFSPVAGWYTTREMRLRDQVAAVDFLSRFGRTDVPAENELLRTAALLSLEDRARLAEVFARRKQTTAAMQLMTPTWAQIQMEGRRAVLPDSQPDFYFRSHARPIARVLQATLVVDPTNALIGPLAETLVMQTRATSRTWSWNTQDIGAAVDALAALDRAQRSHPERSVRVRVGDRVVYESSAAKDSVVTLGGLVAAGAGGPTLRLSLDAGPGDGVVYYYATVTDIPKAPPVTPEDHGIRVERWYERFADATPTTSATEGELVRVRLRVTVPALRQFFVLDDALPAGLEAVDLSLRTASAQPGPGTGTVIERGGQPDRESGQSSGGWYYGSWDSGWWSPFDHRELRDDRVVYSATLLWPGTYTATYLARATTPGTFIRPPAHAEEMYNPALYGRSDGGTFVVRKK